MKSLSAAIFLAFALCGACVTSTGGSPLNAYATSTGDATVAYDLNTLVVVADGTGTAILRDAMTKLTLYPPFAWNGSGVWIKIHNDDGGEKFSGHWDLGVPLPPWTEPYVMAVLSLSEINDLGITFEEQSRP